MSSWYVTPTEFAALVVSAIEEAQYFKHDQPCHPEDIANAFETMGRAVALGISYAGKKEGQKEAVMRATNLRKGTPVLPDDDEIGPYVEVELKKF